MTNAATATATGTPAEETEAREPMLPLRGDTLLGVCEAIGQDLGFNPTWLRLAFASLLLWNPEVVVAAYLGLGIVVAVTRWFFPVSKKPAKADARPQAETAEAAPVAEVREEKELLAA